MTLTLEQWEGILDAVIPNKGDIFKQIKENLKKKHPEVYQELEQRGLGVEHCFSVKLDGWDKPNMGLLHIAAATGHLEIVKYLIEKRKADVDEREERFNRTPLHIAVKNGNLDTVKYLVTNGADVNAKNNDGDTSLHLAAENGKLKIVEYLVTNGADVNAKGYYDYTPLHRAYKNDNDNLDIIKYLVTNGADVNAENEFGKTPFTEAIFRGHSDIVKYLVTNGADVNAKGYYGNTCLHIAVKDGNLDTVKYLVTNGADVNAENEFGKTPFTEAIFRGHSDIVKYLVTNGADVNAKGYYGNTCLHIAVKDGNLDIVKYLVTNGADVNAENEFGETPFTSAKNTDICKLIVNHITRLETAELYIIDQNLKKKNEFINSSNERRNNYLQHLQNCKEEVKEIEKNKPLHEFLRENDVNKMADIWEQNENVCNEFDNEENLKRLYPEYADILINKANEAKKEIFLHNHKPLIDILSIHYKCDVKEMTFAGIRNFFDVHRNDLKKGRIGVRNNTLIYFVDLEGITTRHIPKLKVLTFAETIKNDRKQESKLPGVVASALAASGLTSGMGIAVGACCLVIAAITYYCNSPANLLEDSNVEVVANQIPVEIIT